jgi:hypothetical protein
MATAVMQKRRAAAYQDHDKLAPAGLPTSHDVSYPRGFEPREPDENAAVEVYGGVFVGE